jgi:hypothetical protein
MLESHVSTRDVLNRHRSRLGWLEHELPALDAYDDRGFIVSKHLCRLTLRGIVEAGTLDVAAAEQIVLIGRQNSNHARSSADPSILLSRVDREGVGGLANKRRIGSTNHAADSQP